jgi:multisubunit Na+/H+ antiporter MnhB subunit
LLLAAISALNIQRIYGDRLAKLHPSTYYEQSVVISRLMLPLLILIGGVLLWYGARAPGGAFQAGALIGAAGILLQLAGESSLHKLLAASHSVILRLFLVLGFSTFLAVAVSSLAMGHKMLEYPMGWAGALILIIELAATVSIATTLNVMYACSTPTEELNK